MQRPRFWLSAVSIALVLPAALAVQQGDASATDASASAAKTVSIKGSAFRPATLTVNRGTRVAFANGDNVSHTATKGGAFDTKQIAPGKSAVVRFNQKGTFAYHCKIHPFMKGKVVVK